MTPDLKTCQALKAAEYPQELNFAQWYYPEVRVKPDDPPEYMDIPTQYCGPPNYKSEFMLAIPELEPLLEWFPSFAERWAKKMGHDEWDFKLLRDSHDDLWTPKIWTLDKCDEDKCVFLYNNPSPLTAVLELVKQMIKEMSDVR